MTIRNLCLHSDYNKFELPIQEGVNIIDIGIDITDVLRINDKGASADSVINDKPMTNETHESLHHYGDLQKFDHQHRAPSYLRSTG